MYKPEMHSDAAPYENNCCFPIVAVHQALQSYSKKTGKALEELKIRGRVLDVGCGPGAVTNVFLNHLDPSATLHACDISPQVLEEAAKNNKHGDAKFFCMDATDPIPDFMKGSYDFVFSSFMLHWIQDHRSALKNFASALKEKGQCLICFFANQPIYAAYRDLAKMPKWAPYMTDVEEYITPYQDDAHADVTFRNLLLEAGFRYADVETVQIDYKCIDKSFTYDNHRNILVHVDPFIPRISEAYKDLYIDDLMDAYCANNGFKDAENRRPADGRPVEGTGELLIAVASK